MALLSLFGCKERIIGSTLAQAATESGAAESSSDPAKADLCEVYAGHSYRIKTSLGAHTTVFSEGCCLTLGGRVVLDKKGLGGNRILVEMARMTSDQIQKMEDLIDKIPSEGLVNEPSWGEVAAEYHAFSVRGMTLGVPNTQRDIKIKYVEYGKNQIVWREFSQASDRDSANQLVQLIGDICI